MTPIATVIFEDDSVDPPDESLADYRQRIGRPRAVDPELRGAADGERHTHRTWQVGGDGGGLQQRRSVADTAQLGVLALDHLDRIGAVELVLADARAGHNDSRDGIIGLVGLVRLGLVRQRLGGVRGRGGGRLKGRGGLDGRGVGPLGRCRRRCQGDNAADHGRDEECLFTDTHDVPRNRSRLHDSMAAALS